MEGRAIPRDGSGVYSKPAGTTAEPNTTIESAVFNSAVDDLTADANTDRPIVAGGTGASNAADARTNLGMGNVDNTTDADKPVSTATQAALDLKADQTITITAGASLTGGGNLSANRTLDVAFASQAEAEAGTATDKSMNALRVAQAIAFLGPAGVPSAEVVDQKASGVDGGTFSSGAWRTRDLNTVKRDPNSWVTLSSNQLTFDRDGWVEWQCEAYRCNSSVTRLYNVTDGVAVSLGSNARSPNGQFMTSHSFGGAPVVAGKTYRIEHQCSLTKTNDGLGFPNEISQANIYSRLRYWAG